jgi:hypothetical protein
LSAQNSASDDELDAAMRRLFGDERLAVQARSDAPQAIVAGARRIRRKRAVMTSVAGAAVASLLVVGGLTLGPFRAQQDVAALSSGTLETGAATSTAGGPLSSAPSTPGSTTPLAAPPLVTTSIVARGDAETPPRKPVSKSSVPPSTTMVVTTGPLLGPDGFGQLKLGMTEQDASVKDVTLVKTGTTDACAYYEISGAGVPLAITAAISNAHGLVMIMPPSAVHTPEGIGFGSTKDDVMKRYPATAVTKSGTFSPASQASTYQFGFDAKGQVEGVVLRSTNQDCAG